MPCLNLIHISEQCVLHFHQQALSQLARGSGNCKVLLFLTPILPTSCLFFTWQPKEICKNLYLKPSSCFPFQLEQNLKFYVRFAKLCAIPACIFDFIICRLPCRPLCFSHRGQFPKPVLFLEALPHLFPLPGRLLLWISGWFTQRSGASLNMGSYERLSLTTKCEAVSCFLYHFILIGVLPTTWQQSLIAYIVVCSSSACGHLNVNFTRARVLSFLLTTVSSALGTCVKCAKNSVSICEVN